MNKNQSGFTVIELITAVVILTTMAILFFNENNDIQIAARDSSRKVDINTINQNLQKIYFAEHKYYPREIDENTLPGVFPDSFKDPSGIKINQKNESGKQSDYSYKAEGCNQETGQCKSYELTAKLEGEQDYKVSPKDK